MYVGGNAKMNEFQAAMGICNLRNINCEIEKRKKIIERYTERLNNINGIKLTKLNSRVKSNYGYFPVIFDGYSLSRDEIYEALKNKNIFARKYFYPLTSSLECYKDSFSCQDTPVAEYIAKKVLTLPLYADLALEDVDKICDIILCK
jgi:dTDP-4-amino-4,6-dideoxygalactose transaminase